MKNKFLFIFLFSILLIFITMFFFYPIFISDNIIIEFAINPFNICTKYPVFWKYTKLYFLISCIVSYPIYLNSIYSILFSKKIKKKITKQVSVKNTSVINKEELSILIGTNSNDNKKIYIPEKSLYQNILITGTIGTGKTSSAMYPFTEQLIKFKCDDNTQKIGMLILDAKGNFFKTVKFYANKFGRSKDIIIIQLGGYIKYNPLDKPNLKPSILANRLKTILTLFSKNNTESYWLDKAQQIIEECIKLCRLYNNKYVTFEEIHKLVTIPDYINSKIEILRDKFQKNIFNNSEIYDLLSSINFFQKEFLNLDSRTLSILKSEITRITGPFVSDLDVLKTFCPKKEELNFKGFKEVINNGKIIVLNMNLSEYTVLAKIIATYLKLDFQAEVLSKLSKNNSISKSVAFVCDEFQEFVTTTDANFFAQSREAKCINIVATQSYSSLLDTLNSTSSLKVITQNLINKLWFRNDDIFTIEEAQKQIGKEDKEKFSKSISENAKETKYSYLTNSLTSIDSNISESISTYIHSDYIYDTNFFTQNLETFTCLAFLSDGNKILPPTKIILKPYFY